MNLLIIIIVIALIVLGYLWYTNRLGKICQWCPFCFNKVSKDKPCTTCPPTQPVATAKDATKNEAVSLLTVANGCAYRLKAVVPQTNISGDQLAEFVNGGDHRMVVVTAMRPKAVVSAIMSGEHPAVTDLKAGTLSAAFVGGQKMYIVMSLKEGKLTPAAPILTDTDDALAELNKVVGLNGDSANNLVFLIDEDKPCPPVPPLAEAAGTPQEEPPAATLVEKCCGKWD